MERRLQDGRRKLYSTTPIIGGMTEGERRYNLLVILNYVMSEVPLDVIRHVMFEDESLSDDLLEEVFAAVQLEKGVFGVFQNSMGSDWGAMIVQQALMALDTHPVSERASAVADALAEFLVAKGAQLKNGTSEADE